MKDIEPRTTITRIGNRKLFPLQTLPILLILGTLQIPLILQVLLTDPTDPKGSTDSIDQRDSTYPTDPTDPRDPTELTNPTNPRDPKDHKSPFYLLAHTTNLSNLPFHINCRNVKLPSVAIISKFVKLLWSFHGYNHFSQGIYYLQYIFLNLCNLFIPLLNFKGIYSLPPTFK